MTKPVLSMLDLVAVREDESVYPPQAVLERLYVQEAHPRSVQRLITRSWTKIKSGT